MSDESFETFVGRERERLDKQRQDVFNQQKELENKLAEINRELSAIEAYESAKTGKGAAQQRGRTPRQPRQLSPSGRRMGIRDDIVSLIGGNPSGMTRAQIIEGMGFKGNSSGEASVSNALNNLKKQGKLTQEGSRGPYRVAG